MYVLDFVIPLNRDELCEAASTGQYSVCMSYSVAEVRENLESARTALSEEGTDFIVDHFATFFSLFKHFKQVPDLVKQKGWRISVKAMNLLTANSAIMFEDISNVDADMQRKMCNISKMVVYTLVELMTLFQDKLTDSSNMTLDNKGRKKVLQQVADEDWNWAAERQAALSEMLNLLQLPLKLLWEPPVVEEEFVNLVSSVCYKCLEDPFLGQANQKVTRETIFQILGVLIKNYLHGLSFCVKSMQLLKIHERLVDPLAKGVVQLARECGCKNVVKEIVREVANTDGDQLASDTVGTKSITRFLVQVAEVVPEMLIPAIDLLTQHLAGDSYTMRICVVEILGEIVLTTLTKENLDEELKKLRDEFLDSLQDHVHDVNAFVRSKVLQVWQKLCLAKAIPIARSNYILELVIGRLNDKSTNVKKQAILLVKILLEGNPYSAQLKTEDIRQQYEAEKQKLMKFRDDNQVKGAIGWSEMEPHLQKIIKELSNSGSESEGESDKENKNSEQGVAIDKVILKIGKDLTEGEYRSAVVTIMGLQKEFLAALQLGEAEDDTLLVVLQKIHEQTAKPILNVSPEVLDRLEKHEKTTEYLENALDFALLIDKAVPVILSLLDSSVVTEVLESVQFFTAAYLFGFEQALEGVRKMLYLVFSKEAAIKSAVSAAYEQLYFQTAAVERQSSIQSVQKLSELVLTLNPSQMDALQEVVKEWVKGSVIDKNCIQVMFEKFSKKISGTTEGQSWAALVLIRMVASEEPKVVKNNIPALLSQGLAERGHSNFLLAKETCGALQHLMPPKQPGKTIDQTTRYPNNHEILIFVSRLLKRGLWRTEDPFYIPLAEEAINLVFELSQYPDTFCEDLIADIHDRIVTGKRPTNKKQGRVIAQKLDFDDLLDDNIEEDKECKAEGDGEREEGDGESQQDAGVSRDTQLILLTRFISVLGQVAGNYVLFLEGPVLNELKRRNQVEYERKLKKFQDGRKHNVSKAEDTGNEELEFNRVAADDMDAEEMKKQSEGALVKGTGCLARYVPLVLDICKNPGRYNSKPLQNAALLTLAKFMLVSSAFCEEHLQLLVTLCGRSQTVSHRVNGIIALGALQYRFPNSLEPWTPHMYLTLADPDPVVRINAIVVLTNLIVNEMIKARSHISHLAICVIDKELKIAQTARQFFKEYSQKGNSLYNVLPSLISNLTQPEPTLGEEEFKTVMRFILGLITKDKQSEYLVEKLCLYFESATTERQWKDLAYCLSLLNYSDKALRKVLDNLRCFANKLYLAEVYESFCTIVTNGSKKDKALVDEMQAVIKEYRDKCCEDKNVVVPVKRCPPSTRKRIVRRRLVSGSDEESDESAAHRGSNRPRSGPTTQPRDGNSEDDAFVSHTRASTRKKTQRVKTREEWESSSESDEQSKKPKRRGRQTTSKKTKPQPAEHSAGSSSDERVKRTVRSTRKRK